MHRTLAIVAVLGAALASQASAQTMTLSQTTDSTTVTAVNAIGCHAAGIVSEQSYWRSYHLPSEGITTNVEINAVTFGVERCIPGGGAPTLPIEIRIYFDALATPAGAPTLDPLNLILLHTETVNIPSVFTQAMTFPLSTPVMFAPVDTVVIEIHNADGMATGDSFFVGGNSAGQSNPGYFSSPNCNTTPTDIASFGLPNIHQIIDCNFTIPNQVLDYPGSGDDLSMSSAIGAGSPLSTGPAVDVKQATGGDVLVVSVESPGTTYDFLPFYLLAQGFATGAPPVSPPGFPEVHFNLLQPIFALADGGVFSVFGPVNLIAPSPGSTRIYLIPSVPGASFILQGLVTTAASMNGFFAISDGHEIAIN